MEKNLIINYLREFDENFDLEGANRILNGYGVDSLQGMDGLFLFINTFCDPKEYEKLNDEEIQIFSQILNISSFKDIHKKIEMLSSEDKLEIYNQLGKKYLLPMFVTNSSDVEFCVELIKKSGIDSDVAYDLLRGYDINDKIKLEFFNSDFFDFSLSRRCGIAKTLKNNSYKLDILEIEEIKDNVFEWASIASSITNDVTKISLLRQVPKEMFKLESYSYSSIIGSINSRKLKVNCLKEFASLLHEYQIASIVSNIGDDQLMIQLLNDPDFYFSESSKRDIIRNIDDDKLKLEQVRINGLTNVHDIVSIAISCKEAKNVVTGLNSLIDDENSIAYVLETLVHMERNDSNLIYEGIVPKLSSFICSKYNFNPEHFKYITEKYGFDIIRYLESDSVKKFVNGPIENIDKIAYISSASAINMDDVNNVYNCLLQKKFGLEKSHIVNIFSRLNIAFDERNNEIISNDINSLINHKNILEILKEGQFQEKLTTYGYNVESTKESFSIFLGNLCNDIMYEFDFDKKQELKNILHDITDYYIRTSREQYITFSLEKMGQILKLNRVPDKEKQLKLIFERVDTETIKGLIDKIDRTKVTDEETSYLLSPFGSKIVDACIKFKKSPGEYQDAEITKKELTSKYLKMFNSLMSVCYEQKLLKGICEDNEIMHFEVNPSINGSFYDLLSNLDYNAVSSKLLPYDDKIEKLKVVMEKSKIFGWGETFDRLLSEVGFDGKEVLQSALINSGYKLSESYDCEKLTINNIISFANMNSYTSLVYKSLFEPENCTYLINNPGPNKSSMKKAERLEKAVDYYKQMYERETITIPPIRQEYEVGEGKKLRVVLGDVANPDNLTLGERTGACMRIGGAGDSLFNFCALNESGFHIRFEDPETGKIVSRVSCFRNGNTVFANQLRHSLDNKYNADDLIECLRKVSKDTIELSKNSVMPIDNVVISDGYAMASKRISIDLGIPNVKDGFDYFYSDVDRKAILLESSNDGNLVPIQLSTNLPKYSPIRLEAKKHLDNDEAVIAVNHVKLVEKMLTGESLDSIVPVSDAKVAVTGEDWYVYVDQNGTLHNKIIDGISDQRRFLAEAEMAKHLDPLMNFVTSEKGVGKNAK